VPAIARVGDAGVVHCSGYTIATGSPNVFINGRAVARQGDLSTTHLRPNSPSCTPHTAPIQSCSSTVFINGRGIARVGDTLAGCTSIAQGSPDVFAG
jgi:uncharacterized Zn-binding protein involved in type VI secretion